MTIITKQMNYHYYYHHYYYDYYYHYHSCGLGASAEYCCAASPIPASAMIA